MNALFVKRDPVESEEINPALAVKLTVEKLENDAIVMKSEFVEIVFATILEINALLP